MIIRASLRLIFCWCLVAAFQGSVAFCQDTQPGPFRILVLGDSVMWGQGLKDEHKFSFKVRDWICTRRHAAGRCENADDVQVHVEAHSGAVITRPLTAVQKNEEDQFLRTESPRVLAGEVNYAFPTIWGEVDLAKRYYEANGIPLTDVNLIFVNGGINDMGATKILLPKLGGNIKGYADTYCRDQMLILLGKLVVTFPNARIIVPGYFPLVSLETPWNIVWETIGYLFLNKKDVGSNAGSIKEESEVELDTAPVSKKQRLLHRLLADRSSQWVEASDAAFTEAVDKFNSFHSIVNGAGVASPRAIFVPVAFADVNAYAAPTTFLWTLVRKPAGVTFECTSHDPLKNIIVRDELQPLRPCMCELAGKGGNISCVRAATFHPNTEGAERYFSVIKTQLESIWDSTGW